MNIAIIAPVFNDWESARQLYAELERELARANHRASIWFIDDGSSEQPVNGAFLKGQAITEAHVIELHGNQGHQRAIAAGLAYLAPNAGAFDGFLIMDSDGEDKPNAVPAILDAATGEEVILALRAKRNECFSFRAGYFLYKILFFLCTGRSIGFGNFLFLPRKFGSILSYSQFTASHLAATVVKLGLPSRSLKVDRGPRYAGHTRMNYISLVLHGLNAIYVFKEIALTRVVLVTLLIAGIVFGGIAATFAALFLCLTIPLLNWAFAPKPATDPQSMIKNIRKLSAPVLLASQR